MLISLAFRRRCGWLDVRRIEPVRVDAQSANVALFVAVVLVLVTLVRVVDVARLAVVLVLVTLVRVVPVAVVLVIVALVRVVDVARLAVVFVVVAFVLVMWHSLPPASLDTEPLRQVNYMEMPTERQVL